MPITPRELSAEQLRRLCSPDEMTFQSTAELALLDDIIGQERATRAIEFGLDIPYYGYNIFALGPSGAGKTTTITQYLERKAATLPIPNDWAYVNDFERPDEPKALRLPPGGGAKLRDRFDRLLDELEELLPKAFESENYEQHRKEMVQELDERRQQVVEAMEAWRAQPGLCDHRDADRAALCAADRRQGRHPRAVRAAAGGAARRRWRLPNRRCVEQMEKTLREVKAINDEATSRLQHLDREIAAATLGPGFDELKEQYAEWDDILTYLEDVRQHIAHHVDRFKIPDR